MTSTNLPQLKIHPSVQFLAVSPSTYLANRPDSRYNVIGTGAIVLDKSQPLHPRILLLQRAANDSLPGKWEIPGGGCDDEDETILHGAARELWEETRLRATSIGPMVGAPHIFASRSGKKVCRFTFVVDVETDANGSPVGFKISEEHDHFLWANREEVVRKQVGDMSLEFTKQEAYELILEAFSVGDTGQTT